MPIPHLPRPRGEHAWSQLDGASWRRSGPPPHIDDRSATDWRHDTAEIPVITDATPAHRPGRPPRGRGLLLTGLVVLGAAAAISGGLALAHDTGSGLVTGSDGTAAAETGAAGTGAADTRGAATTTGSGTTPGAGSAIPRRPPANLVPAPAGPGATSHPLGAGGTKPGPGPTITLPGPGPRG